MAVKAAAISLPSAGVAGSLAVKSRTATGGLTEALAACRSGAAALPLPLSAVNAKWAQPNRKNTLNVLLHKTRCIADLLVFMGCGW